MHIAVIGAGIVGVTTAHELATDGHAVTVFERRPSVAAEASFANAGIVGPSLVSPWAAPGMPTRMLAGLLSRHGGVRLKPGALASAPWLWRYLRSCRKTLHARHRATLAALARLSQDRLQGITESLKLDYEQSEGCLVLLRTPREMARGRQSAALLADMGVTHELVDA
ncbi:MAG TPA: FAD-dependent oxidoreductase, partial [Burkholderiaceae bacterium]|nr:FAD-dependent oxidoreductase [Burkholderiaceae bacterium]